MLDSTDSTAAEQTQTKRQIPMMAPSTNRIGSNSIRNNPRIAFSSILRIFNGSIPSAAPQVHFVGEFADDMLLFSDGSQSGKYLPCGIKHKLMILEQILQIYGIDAPGLVSTLCQLIEIVAVAA